jgi:hypothetical protein
MFTKKKGASKKGELHHAFLTRLIFAQRYEDGISSTTTNTCDKSDQAGAPGFEPG